MEFRQYYRDLERFINLFQVSYCYSLDTWLIVQCGAEAHQDPF